MAISSRLLHTCKRPRGQGKSSNDGTPEHRKKKTSKPRSIFLHRLSKLDMFLRRLSKKKSIWTPNKPRKVATAEPRVCGAFRVGRGGAALRGTTLAPRDRSWRAWRVPSWKNHGKILRKVSKNLPELKFELEIHGTIHGKLSTFDYWNNWYSRWVWSLTRGMSHWSGTWERIPHRLVSEHTCASDSWDPLSGKDMDNTHECICVYIYTYTYTVPIMSHKTS